MSRRYSSVAHSIERALPGFPFDAILPWRRRAVRAGGATPIGHGDVRVLIGPENSAGQAYAWSRAITSALGESATSLMIRSAGDRWQFPADHVVASADAAHLPWQRAQWRAVGRFTHVILESGRPLFGDDGTAVDAQVRRLMKRGIKVALLWHGSDIRGPHSHAAREAFSPFRVIDSLRVEEIADRVSRNRELANALRIPQFVSTPDLLIDAPEATWLPVVVDCDEWSHAGIAPPFRGQRPVVAHAPSDGPMKGTGLVRPLLRKLHDEGLLEYREAEGLPSTSMRDFFSSADIVLDQFALGSFGVASSEALSAGRLVIGHVSPQTRAVVEAVTGRQLPIVQSTADTLESTLRTIVADPAQFSDVADRGREYARAVHDGRFSAQVLGSFLGVPHDSGSQHGHGTMDECPLGPMEGENG
ncbi:glycosyltransferase [Microbacterium murale]|uniref:Glycosyltransferase involved in cell wall biosynthesis n=1 Tax=Microbacterium murale TaxID=1081040 RepID=A0ABU0PCG0_9MICO|nr:hypothetical protein [Microbacterium murale]MDQ0645032.1 hypothetical protein [Microbacterium murale]